MSLLDFSAVEVGKRLKAKEISVREVIEEALFAAESDTTNSYICITKDKALSEADKIQAGINSGELISPIAGVPIAIKDNICTKGIETTCASKMLSTFIPPYNATVLDRLEACGTPIVGKLNMDEFAMGSTGETSYFGAVLNPFDRSRVSGGSSGGAAAAVADRKAFFALGSDTGGSIRQPCSYCGVTGIKPTYGTVSRYGLIAYASSLDQIGPVGRSAQDVAALLDEIAVRDVRDGTSVDGYSGKCLASLGADIKGLKIGVVADCFGEGLQSEVKESIYAALGLFAGMGAEIEEFTMPMLEYAVPTYYIIAAAEAASNLSRFDGIKYGYRAKDAEGLQDVYLKSRTEGFGTEVKRRILLGNFVLSSGYYDAYYKKALQVKAAIKKGFDEAFSKYGLLVMPVAPTTAPRLGESLSDPLKMYLSDIYTVSINLAGLPAASVPCGFDKKGMPIGMQLVGSYFTEPKILNTAYMYQQMTEYHQQKPRKEGVCGGI